jgi:3D (Asp-Asp-Asp) domain-containing protein
MHERFSSDHIDIWMPTRESAQNFGVKETVMEILE